MAQIDEEYIAKMEDVLAVYEKHYRVSQPVVCFDEKPVSLHAEVRQGSPATPGHLARRDGEYKRCGTANVFCAVEPKVGRHFAWVTPNRSGDEFAKVIAALVNAYPWAKTIHLVLDNLNIHRRKSLTSYFGERKGGYIWRRLTVHYTPKHGSWLNQAEIEISMYSRQCLGRRRLANRDALAAETKSWVKRMNRERRSIAWKFGRTDAHNVFHYAK